MLIEVSIGEALDKLNILELKLERIKQEERLINVRKELEHYQEVLIYKDKYALQYKLLNFINSKIWELTDIIKSLSVNDPTYATAAYNIFELNQGRFRMKNIINLSEVGMKEQKSYSESTLTLIIDNLEFFYSKLSVINYYSTKYDHISIITPFPIVQTLFNTPNYSYIETAPEHTQNLSEIELPLHCDPKVFDFPVINYIAGGLLGDFIHQLSIINEKFRQTGRKGNLYIANIGDNFRFGLDKAYEDTRNIVLAQRYISTYAIHSGEPVDINLSAWRDTPLVFKANWKIVFNPLYDIDWGSHKWLNLPTLPYYRDTVIISYTPRRPIKETNAFLGLKGRPVLFLTFDLNEYLAFSKLTSTNFDCLKLNSLEQMAAIINSCSLFIGNLTAPLTLALAVHKKCIVLFNNDVEPSSMRYLNLYDDYSYVEYDGIDALTC